MLIEFPAVPINPPTQPAAWWWVLVMALAGVGIAAITAAIRGWLHSRRQRNPLDPVDDLTAAHLAALAAIDQAAAAHASGELTAALACQQISRATRRFVALGSGGDADYSTAGGLTRQARRDVRLQSVAQFTAAIQAACFDPAAGPDVEGWAAQAKEVCAQWL